MFECHTYTDESNFDINKWMNVVFYLLLYCTVEVEVQWLICFYQLMASQLVGAMVQWCSGRVVEWCSSGVSQW